MLRGLDTVDIAVLNGQQLLRLLEEVLVFLFWTIDYFHGRMVVYRPRLDATGLLTNKIPRLERRRQAINI